MSENKILEIIVDIGFNVVKDKVKTEAEKIAIKERLREYLKKQSKINFNCSLQEELDFGGLCEYIQTELLEDVKRRFYGTKKERCEARNKIINKTIEYSQAHTELQKSRAIKMVDTAIDILNQYYRHKVNRELKFLSAEIEDTIIDANEKQHQIQSAEIISAVQKSEERIIDSVERVVKTTMPISIDSNSILLQKGELSEVEKNIARTLDALGVNHILYPDYKLEYDSKKQRFLSKPLNEAALKKYPPKISGVAKIMLNGKYLNNFDYKIIDYANRHQLPITIDILEAKKYLGDIVDPIQHEADDLVGERIIVPPRPFAPAFPCSITIDEDIIFDYILLRVQEKLDDGTIVISNKEQLDFPIKFTMKVNLTLQKATYKLSVDAKCNEDTARYLRIIKRTYSGGIIRIKALSTGEEFSRGNLTDVDYSGVFESIDDELTFVENVITIEKYFNINIVIPEKIEFDDLNIISYFAMLIRGDTYSNKWDKFEFPITVSEDFKRRIISETETSFSLSYVGNISADVFGNKLTLPLIRTLEAARYENLDRLKEKVSVLDSEDEIKVVMLPAEGESGVWYDMLKTDDKI